MLPSFLHTPIKALLLKYTDESNKWKMKTAMAEIKARPLSKKDQREYDRFQEWTKAGAKLFFNKHTHAQYRRPEKMTPRHLKVNAIIAQMTFQPLAFGKLGCPLFEIKLVKRKVNAQVPHVRTYTLAHLHICKGTYT